MTCHALNRCSGAKHKAEGTFTVHTELMTQSKHAKAIQIEHHVVYHAV